MEFEKKLKFEHNPQLGHHMRVTRAEASKVKGEKDYIELKTQKNGVSFTTYIIINRIGLLLEGFQMR